MRRQKMFKLTRYMGGMHHDTGDEEPTRHRKRAPKVKPYVLMYRHTAQSWADYERRAAEHAGSWYVERVKKGNIWQVHGRYATERALMDAYKDLSTRARNGAIYWRNFEYKPVLMETSNEDTEKPEA